MSNGLVSRIVNFRFLMTTLVVAAVYCFVGRLGLFLAVAPGYATIMWPAAGVALAALLIYGNQYWLAILLGSFFVNLWISLDISTAEAIWMSLLVAFGISVGAVLQALVGTALVRYFVGYPDPLCDVKKIILFALLSAPVSSIVNATWSNALLWGLHYITIENLPQNWLTWWAGDSIGILVFTPLLFVFFAKPRSVWRNRIFSVVAPLSVFFIISIIIFILLTRQDLAEAKTRFNTQISSISYAFRRNLRTAEDAIYSIKNLYLSSDDVTRSEFHTYVSRILKKNNSIQAISWNPVVSSEQKADYIRKAKEAGFPDFEFKQIENNQLVPDKERPYYYIVYYVEPYIGNESTLGMNLASSKLRLDAIERAAKEDALVVTPGVNLVQGAGQQYGVILFAPLYKRNYEPVAGIDNSKYVIGFLSEVLRLKTIVKSILLSSESSIAKKLFINGYINVVLLDVTDPSNKQLLYENEPSNSANKKISDLINSIALHSEYKFGGRTWLLTVAPTEKYLAELFSWRSWTALVFSLLFLGVINLFLLVISGQQIKIRREVEDKTASLIQADLEKKLILDSVGEAVIGMDVEGITTFSNPEAEKILGFTNEELLGNSLHELTHRYHKDGTRYLKETCAMHVVTKNQSVIRNQVEYLQKKNGEFVPIEYSKTPIFNNGVLMGVVLSFSDISSWLQTQEELEWMAMYDELTGIPNRKSFRYHLSEAIVRCKNKSALMAVCFLDIDNFKHINDVYGHDFGDAFLIQMSNKLKNMLRSSDYIARIGGDEFTMCIEDFASGSELRQILQRYLTLANEAIRVNDVDINTSVSIGATLYPSGGSNAAELMQRADLSMHQAKYAGKNTFVIFNKEIDRLFKRQLAIDRQLKSGISRNEFSLVYHPIISVSSGLVAGLEILLRWNNHDLGLVGPAEFIPIAEKNGLIVDVTQWCIREFLKNYNHIRAAFKGNNYFVTINISSIMFDKEKVMNAMIDLLKEAGVDFSKLIFEITETVFLNQTEELIAWMNQMTALGIRFAIDDFGTGYSSLQYLSDLPVSVLKIDQSFVHNYLKEYSDEPIINAIIQLARSFNLITIAEGVEEKLQFEFLKKQQCDYVQGFYFSKPLILDDLLKYLIEKF